jgi:hypothetical protein
MQNSSAMNLRETIISSFFTHLIIILILVSAGKYTVDLSGNLKNVISVDLASEIGKVLSTAADDPTAEHLQASRPTSDEKMSMPDQSADTPQEEKSKFNVTYLLILNCQVYSYRHAI